MNYYTVKLPSRVEKCKECGELAEVIFVANYLDCDGYQDQIPLCAKHANEFYYDGDRPSEQEDE